ncbi:MAG: sensor histidine kinase [Spirochaetaceae bacterium]|nr:sensor histidine kinase [Spirochaetaceae bacterium]MDT8299027.1 sensor histidine kinase [Spirochaetaceae bacterium]
MMNRTTLPDFVPREVKGRDELGYLEERFNTLMGRNKELIDQEYVREIQLKGARLRALQAQINPHFLNNTLHMIGGMALARHAPEIYEITRAVGDLFRYANGSEGDLVTMADELEHTRNYLLIQQNRFVDRLTWSVDADPELNGILIPRFTLQPIVENAFEHGLQPKSGSWEISIRIAGRSRGVLAAVRDDGVGMSREKLRYVRQMLRSPAEMSETSESHIGLRNVDARLRLHFGHRRGLRVFSEAGEGTTIILNIPAVTNKERVLG